MFEVNSLSLGGMIEKALLPVGKKHDGEMNRESIIVATWWWRRGKKEKSNRKF